MRSPAAALFRLLATLAVLGQVLVGALVVPDDARAADFAAIGSSSTLCGAPPATPAGGDRRSPLHRQPICALSLSLTSHAAPLVTHPRVPLASSATGAVSIIRPRFRAPPPGPLRAAALPRGPPTGF